MLSFVDAASLLLRCCTVLLLLSVEILCYFVVAVQLCCFVVATVGLAKRRAEIE